MEILVSIVKELVSNAQKESTLDPGDIKKYQRASTIITVGSLDINVNDTNILKQIIIKIYVSLLIKYKNDKEQGKLNPGPNDFIYQKTFDNFGDDALKKNSLRLLDSIKTECIVIILSFYSYFYFSTKNYGL